VQDCQGVDDAVDQVHLLSSIFSVISTAFAAHCKFYKTLVNQGLASELYVKFW